MISHGIDFILRYPIGETVQIEVIVQLAHSKGQKSSIAFILFLAGIEKRVHSSLLTILLFAVPVKINHHLYSVLLVQRSYVLLNNVSLWTQLLHRLGAPLSVQIESCQIASGMPIDNSIGVDHRNDDHSKVFEHV